MLVKLPLAVRGPLAKTGVIPYNNPDGRRNSPAPRFHVLYRKSLQRRTRRFIDTLTLAFAKSWEQELDSTIAGLTAFRREPGGRVSVFSPFVHKMEETGPNAS